MDFLRDQVWQFVGVIVGFTAIAVTIYLSRKQRRLNRIDYAVTTNETVLSIKEGEEVRGKVKVIYTYGGHEEEIRDARLIILKIWNSGNVSIRQEDFIDPDEQGISFSFGVDAKVLYCEIADREPKNIKANLKTDSNKVTLEKLDFLDGDIITIKILLTKTLLMTSWVTLNSDAISIVV